MSDRPDGLEWPYVRIALGVVALIVVVDVVGWKVHDIMHPRPTRPELTLRCLNGEKGVATVAPAGDPLASSAGSGSLRTTIEGNDVTVALASSEKQAAEIERYYRAVADGLEGRLERRGRTVYLCGSGRRRRSGRRCTTARTESEHRRGRRDPGSSLQATRLTMGAAGALWTRDSVITRVRVP